MQHTLLPIDPSAPLFPTPHELRASLTARAQSQADVARDQAEDTSVLAGTGPISERFCGAQAVSALLGFASAPLLAHAAAVSSHSFVWCGLSCLAAAVAIQVSERRRVIVQLTQAARARGADLESARRQARATLELWLS